MIVIVTIVLVMFVGRPLATEKEGHGKGCAGRWRKWGLWREERCESIKGLDMRHRSTACSINGRWPESAWLALVSRSLPKSSKTYPIMM